MWRGLVARPSLLTPRVVAPPPGGLVTMSRSLHSKGHMDITVTVTGKANFSLLASFLKSQEDLEKSVQLPQPRHPGREGSLQQLLKLVHSFTWLLRSAA